MLEARGLRKVLIPTSLISNPSPGSLQSTRLALHVSGDGSSCFVYVASGCRIYKVEMSLDDSVVSKGKDSLLVPILSQAKNSSLVDRCPHRSEIQSVIIADGDGDTCLVLGTVDSYGHLIVSRLDTASAVLPSDCGVGEGSWAGVCFSPRHLTTTAVARSFCKTIDVYDQDIHLRSLHTLLYPASICYLPSLMSGNDSSSVLAVAEGSQLTIWDLRVKENGGCVQRVCGSIGDVIYAVCTSSEGAIAVGGSDRTVTVYDPRRWCSLSRWVNCSKYEITGLSFSSADPSYIYIQGVDYEVFCGHWLNTRKAFAFRGDSNWLGFNKCPNLDIVGGWCDSGSIFVADVINGCEEST